MSLAGFITEGSNSLLSRPQKTSTNSGSKIILKKINKFFDNKQLQNTYTAA